VIREYNEPYENLYIQAMPPAADREFIDSLIQNQDIFQPDLLYRPTDPNFGRATTVVYDHAFGLTASTIEEYYNSLYENHYWKNLTLGEIKVAQALDNNDNVIYEVIYSAIQDNLSNNQGESVSKEVILPYPINEDDSTEVSIVYPNSLINMRDQVIDTVGQIANILPLWMTSKQANGRVLGFTPAWVLAYVKPGRGEQIAYYIRTKFGERLNLIDFEVDRYELDRLLTKNWDPAGNSTTGAWEPVAAETTFDLDNHYQLPVPDDSSLAFTGGIGYSIGDTILILGNQVGGVDVTNNITITVDQVDANGTIVEARATGFAPLFSTGNTYTNVIGTNKKFFDDIYDGWVLSGGINNTYGKYLLPTSNFSIVRSVLGDDADKAVSSFVDGIGSFVELATFDIKNGAGANLVPTEVRALLLIFFIPMWALVIIELAALSTQIIQAVKFW
jgi:hypothetical protein